MEGPNNNFEEREREIDGLIEDLATTEEMDVDDMLAFIATFDEDEGEGDPHDVYLKEVAKKLDIPEEEMIRYALKKAEEYLKGE